MPGTERYGTVRFLHVNPALFYPQRRHCAVIWLPQPDGFVMPPAKATAATSAGPKCNLASSDNRRTRGVTLSDALTHLAPRAHGQTKPPCSTFPLCSSTGFSAA